MSAPVGSGEDVVHNLRRRLAEYAMAVDTLGRLADRGTEHEVIDAMLDLVGDLCAGAALAFVPSAGAAAAGDVTRPPTSTARSSTGAAAAALADGEDSVLLDRGFAVRVGSEGQSAGVIAVVDLAFPENRDEYASMVLAVSGVMAMALHGARTRSELTEREELYRLLAENATDAVFLVSPEWRFTWVSPATRGVLGYDPQDLVGIDTRDIVHPEDLPALAAVRAPIVQGQAGIGFELRARTASGEYRWMSGLSCPAVDADGAVTGRITTLRDIHEQVLARQELTAERERLQLVLESSRLGLWDWNMQTGEALLDERWAEIVGYGLAELEPVSEETWRTLTSPDDRAAEDEMTERHARGLVTYYDLEVRLRHKDGHWVWVHDRGRIVEWTPDGRPLRMTGTHEDISELVQAREEAMAGRALLQATMDSLLDPHVFLLAVRDDGGRIVDFVYADANDAACDYNHMSREDTIGARLLDVLPGHTGSGLLETYAAVVDTGVPYIVDGQVYFNEILGKELRSDVRGIRVGDGLSLTWREVTERYEVAEALAESEQRFRLLAENASDVVYLAGPDRRVQWIAPSVGRTLGWEPDEIVGTEAIELLHPDDRPLILAAREMAYTGAGVPDRKDSEGLLLRVRKGSGEYVWVMASNTPLYDEAGRLQAVVGSMRDVDDLVRAQQEVSAEQARLQATLNTLLDPHVRLEAVRGGHGTIVDFVYADANDAACAYMLMDRNELVGAHLLDLLPGQAGSGMLALYAGAVETGLPLMLDDYAYPHEIVGSERRYDIRANRVGDALSFTWRDVTDRYAAAAALARSEQRYRLLAENVTDVVTHVRDDVIVWVSASVERTLGWSPDELVGRRYLDFTHPDDRERVRAGAERLDSGRTGRGRYRMRAKAGTYHWIDSHGGPLLGSDGAQDGIVVSVRVVDAEVRAQEMLEVRARQDQLTGLANREEVFERLRLMLGRAVRTGSLIAVVFCDFDRFKDVNDTFGHAGGDALLRITSDRFRSAVRAGDLVARIGGDELLVVLDGVHDLDNAVAIAEKLRQVVLQPVEVPGGVVLSTMSFGVTIAAPGEELDDVVARADGAMYRAKQDGRDQVAAVESG